MNADGGSSRGLLAAEASCWVTLAEPSRCCMPDGQWVIQWAVGSWCQLLGSSTWTV